MTLNIAQGLKVNAKTWKNKKISWTDLVSKLKSPVITEETVKEYQTAHKRDKLKIKDSGGYVGGYLRGGRRKPENVVYRQLLTLDLDFADSEVWESFTLLFDNAAVLHSTHSHTPEQPKYRLIMPLNREATPEEYEAVGRQIAGQINIELFDNTGFQPYRLMFWPSHSVDAKYEFYEQDGPWLDVDEILDTYDNWLDSSLWPTSRAYVDQVKERVGKQQDPTCKEGLVGTFCRAYGIEEAIAQFLSKQYEKISDTRYTYKKGSTAGGLVVYENKFAYSHHGTDPISGNLCNAFDLVRMHKFLDLDENSTSKGVRLPSYQAMQELASKDKQVKKQIARETLADAKEAFSVPVDDEEEQDLSWLENLEVDRKGAYRPTANNINLILANDPRLKGVFRFNRFDGKRYVFKNLPWRTPEMLPDTLRNIDYAGLRNYIEIVYGISSSAKIDDALSLILEENAYHPLKSYLNECAKEWDKKPRLETLLIDFLGAKDSVYSRRAISIWAAAAVARVFQPGIKFDLVLTLVGEQGEGKSTFFHKLGVGWTSDSFMGVKGKEAYEQLQGAWIIEVAELSGFRKDDIEAVKHFITKQEDTFRPAYGRGVETFKRQCVFGATTNRKEFLRDDTGNRRFLPIDTNLAASLQTPFDLDEAYIKQVWGEAVHLWRSGIKLYLDGESKRIARIEQNLHREVDERTGVVDKFLNTPVPDNWPKLTIMARQMYFEEPSSKGEMRDVICIAEIWCECLGQPLEQMNRWKTSDLNKIMKGFPDWEPINSTKNFGPYGRQRYYRRIAKD